MLKPAERKSRNGQAPDTYICPAETGLYYLQSRYYDTAIGRFISADEPALLKKAYESSHIGADLYTYCQNNPTNSCDANGCWAQNYSGFQHTWNGFNVNMNWKFISRAFCLAYASDVIYRYGSWYWWGKGYKSMGILRIAVELFSHAIGYYVGRTLNYINSSWGNSLINSGSVINVNKNDNRAWAFYGIWNAATVVKYNWRVRLILPYWLWGDYMKKLTFIWIMTALCLFLSSCGLLEKTYDLLASHPYSAYTAQYNGDTFFSLQYWFSKEDVNTKAIQIEINGDTIDGYLALNNPNYIWVTENGEETVWLKEGVASPAMDETNIECIEIDYFDDNLEDIKLNPDDELYSEICDAVSSGNFQKNEAKLNRLASVRLYFSNCPVYHAFGALTVSDSGIARLISDEDNTCCEISFDVEFTESMD